MAQTGQALADELWKLLLARAAGCEESLDRENRGDDGDLYNLFCGTHVAFACAGVDEKCAALRWLRLRQWQYYHARRQH